MSKPLNPTATLPSLFAAALFLLASAGTVAAKVTAPEMVRIPAGTAQIGDDRGRPDERPAFKAKVAAFDLDRSPVTVAAFGRFVKKTGYVTEAEKLGSAAVMSFGTGRWSLVNGAQWRMPRGPGGGKADEMLICTQI